MRPVMRQGHTEPRISIQDAIAQPHAFAVGAIEGLAGEIAIIDGDVWVARPEGGQLQVTGPKAVSGDQATLLTLAYVDQWQSFPIDTAVQGDDLESLIMHTADANGIDTTKPFPFVIKGKLTDIDLHVINGYCPIATDPSTVDAQPWKLANTKQTEAVIVGFFAQNAAGVLTHHGTAIHAHAIITSKGETITGHIDRVVVEPGMTLRLPSQ